MSDNKPSPISVAAATDVSEFFTDLVRNTIKTVPVLLGTYQPK